MARIFLDADESRNGGLLTGDVVFGNSGAENVTINTGATGVRIEGTIEGIALVDAPAAYTYLAQGNNLVVYSGGVEVARIIVQDDADGTTLTFPGGTTTVNVGAGGMTIGGTAVPTGTAGVVIPGNLDPDTALTTALGTLATAQAAQADYLEGLDLDNDPTTPTTEADVDAAVTGTEAALDAELAGISLADTIDPNDFINGGDNVRAGLIADGQAALAANVTAANSALTAANTAAGADVVAALDQVDARSTEVTAAVTAANTANVAEDAEALKFNALNTADISFNGGRTELSLGGTLVAKLVGDTWTLETGAAAQTAIDDATGFDAYFASLQAEATAAAASDAAQDALTGAVLQVVQLENGDDTLTEADLAPGVVSVDPTTGAVTVNFDASVAPPAALGVAPTQGVTATTETAVVTFQALAAGDSVTVNGRTLTADALGAGVSLADVVAYFADTGTPAAPTDGIATDTSYDAAFAVTGTAGATVSYEATVDGNVTDIAVSSLANVSTSQGVTAVDESYSITFGALLAGQSVTVGGLTLTATGDLTAAEVAAAFDNLATGTTAAGAGAVTDGEFSGTLSADYDSAAAVGNTVVFTSNTSGTNVVDLTTSVAGGSATAPNAQDVLDARASVEGAQAAVEDLNDAIAAWQGAVAVQDELGGLNDAVDAARAAIEDPVADGGLGVSLREGADNFTANDDVYLFAQGTDQTLTGFGAAGSDRLYVQGDFTLVELTDEVIGDDAVGSASELEIFIQQDGANTVIYVENSAFDGTETAGLGDAGFDGTVITLTNTTAADVQFNNGYFSIA